MTENEMSPREKRRPGGGGSFIVTEKSFGLKLATKDQEDKDQ